MLPSDVQAKSPLPPVGRPVQFRVRRVAPVEGLIS